VNFFARTFGALQPAYLVRAYVIGFALLALIGWVQLHAPDDHGQADRYLSLGYFFVCSLLFGVVTANRRNFPRSVPAPPAERPSEWVSRTAL
jgi:hypothetical protein